MNALPRIKTFRVLPDYRLDILFDDGRHVTYDVAEDIEQIADFQPLRYTCGLWQQAQLDRSRTCVYWNDRIDLPSDTLYEYGQPA